MCCLKVMFTIKATFSAEESASFINKKGTVEENVSILSDYIVRQYLDNSYIRDLLCLENCV